MNVNTEQSSTQFAYTHGKYMCFLCLHMKTAYQQDRRWCTRSLHMVGGLPVLVIVKSGKGMSQSSKAIVERVHRIDGCK